VIQQQVNLYHPIFRRQEKKFSALAMLQAGGAVLGGIILIYAYSAWQLSSLRQASAQIERETVTATQQIEQMGRQLASRPADPALKDEVQRLEMMVDASQRLRGVLQRERFGNTEGFSNHLIAFARQHVAGVWLTGVSIDGAGEDLTVEGHSSDPELVPRYLQKLSAEKILSGTQFQTFVMNRPEGKATNYVEFLVKTGVTEIKSSKKKP